MISAVGGNQFPVPSIDDYAEKTRETVAAWKGMSGQQSGDPARLAEALMQLIENDAPPLRWPAGADAVETVEKKGRDLIDQANAYRELSSSLGFDNTSAAASPEGGR